MYHLGLYLGAVQLLTFLVQCAVIREQIPSVSQFVPTVNGTSFVLSSNVRIVVDSQYAHQGKPSLRDFAFTFREDLVELTGFTRLEEISVSPLPHSTKSNPVIFLTLESTFNHTLFNGEATGEGYDFIITENSYVIKGAQPIGTWWGTRTLLQQVAMILYTSPDTLEPLVSSTVSKGAQILIISGEGSDSPGWEVRGFMLDAGRHWFETSFLADLCSYASFFKLNEFHIHASDNLWNPNFLYGAGNEEWRSFYAGFRFLPPPGSPIDGLVTRRNESWSQADFLDLQSHCSAHGITIIPEIDTPGHSLIISQWKPELMIQGTPDHLNLSHPETTPTIKSIWEQFLPWFMAAEVSIGADEYDPKLADEYISFVNEMAQYIGTAGKHIRIWGTNEPSDKMAIFKNVTIQHWDFPGDDIPVQLMNTGYHVINSEQSFLYLDGKTSDSGQFPQELNQTLMWHGASGGKGWAPNIFSPVDESNNTSIDNPLLRGSIFALWSDWGNNATTQLEVYYQLARSIAVFSEKTWAGSDVRDTALTQNQFNAIYPVLNAAAPGQNLNRVVIPKMGATIYSYDLRGMHLPVATQYSSVGPPYTLTFTVKPDSHSPIEGVLFSGSDTTLHIQNLAFEDNATKQLYALNYTLPPDRYTDVMIHATREYTYVVIDGNEDNKLWWMTSMDIWGEYMAAGNMSFAAPAQMIGGQGFKGSFGKAQLRLGD